MVLSLTSDNRREYVQVKVMQVFKRICNFKLSDNTLFGELNITNIKSMHVMMWQKECGLSSQTIATNRAYLNIVMQSAMNDDLIHKNPVQLVKLPKRKEVREKSYYTEDEIKTIIQTAQGQLKNYIQLCCFTGMRGSELLALRWSDDIDFEKGVIRVDTRIVLGKEDETKSRKIRFIPMFKQAREALVRQRQFSGLREFVFINKNGDEYFGTQFMGDSFSKMLKDNNLKHGTMHDLRRSFNTILKQYGYPTDWILDIMGHMDDRINRNHYTGHLTVDMSKLEAIAL
jgi:integrase